LAVKGVRERNMKIIGISGKKGAGKTTVAEYLDTVSVVERWVALVGFASVIKEEYCNFFAPEVHPTDLDIQSVKDTVGKHGKTHRIALQEFGVGMRDIDPNVWVRAWAGETKKYACDLMVVPDVRFPNEVTAIHDMGGKVIRLTRCPHPEDTHESETALDFTEALIKADYPMEFVKESERDIYFDAILATEREWI
jgi:hypothetical protein